MKLIILLILVSCTTQPQKKESVNKVNRLQQLSDQRYDKLFFKISGLLFDEKELEVISLIEKNKNILEKKDRLGNNILQIAIEYKSKKLFDYLVINYKFDLNHKNTFGNTALMMAIDNNNQEMALDLVIRKPNIHIKSSFDETALVLAVKKNLLDLVIFLLDNNANPYDKAFMGRDLIEVADTGEMKAIIQKYRKSSKINNLIKKK